MRQIHEMIDLMRDDKAGAAIEYGLLVGLIAISLLIALQHTASETISMWTMIKAKFASVM